MRGFKRPLDFTDIWSLDDRLVPVSSKVFFNELANCFRFNAERLAVDFDQAWSEMLKKHNLEMELSTSAYKDSYVPGTLLRTLVWNRLFLKMFLIGWLNMLNNVCTIISPLFLSWILTYATDRSYDVPNTDKSNGRGAGLILGLFLVQIVAALSNAHFSKYSVGEGVKLRATISSIIYRKSLRLNSAARQEFNAGQIMNLVSSDCNRIELFLTFCSFAWVSPVSVICYIGFLINYIGASALVGIAVIFGTLPIQAYLFKNLSLIRGKIAPVTDKRVKTTNEVFAGIRLIKFFGWEAPFLKEILDLRKIEMVQVLRRSIFNAFAMTVAFGIPVLAMGFSFMVYGAVNNGVLDPVAVFPALTYFQSLRFPMMFLPFVMSSWAEFKVAIVRIEKLLLAPELDEQPKPNPSARFAVEIKNGEFVWEASTSYQSQRNIQIEEAGKKNRKWSKKQKKDPESTQPLTPNSLDDSTEVMRSHLRGINLQVEKGKLVAIVGAVGSGKSSLLNAIIGEIKKVDGSVVFNSSMGYAPQTAWIQNATVKENILFGHLYDRDRYLRAIRDCALETDLRVLPDGDQTSIGERGINLSGGQKQRVNLARLVYYNADIVLMDDPLSAVDAHVGRYLFENCILGALKDKTRILVTHQLHFLSRADHIVVMRSGEIVEQGAYQDLANLGGEFATLIQNYGAVDDTDDEDNKSIETDEKTHTRLADEKKALDKMDGDMNQAGGKDIMQAEEREVGVVGWDIWLNYMHACGGWFFFFMSLGLFAILQTATVLNNLWLSWWSEGRYDNTLNSSSYIGIFFFLGLCQCLCTYLVNTYYAHSCTRASGVLHQAALSRIIRAPTLFFDTTPLGRIMNRFSKDQDSIDSSLPDAFRSFLSTFSNAISTFALIIYATPIFAAVLFPVLVGYYFVQNLYRATSRELKRLDSISRSPLYANFGATIAGLSTIRAYGEQSRFIVRTDISINENNAPYYLLILAQRWLSVRLESLGALLILAAATFGVIANGSISPALLGLSLSYALQVTNTLSWCIRQFTDTEIAMNAVERVKYYAEEVEMEAAAIIEHSRPPKNWPTSGAIQFENLEMRYAPGLPLVVKGVSFNILDKQKIGIVGRTGSGKSSLMQALFRMVEPSGGRIVIDGVDTSLIGLKDLRTGLSIIPQDPILFTGTFRSNLDPFGEYSDSDIWDAVNRSGLKSKVSESEKGLDALVEDGGDNLSVGQRQLVCLARAMVKKPKILIMDEATANVDHETDALIQKALREDFSSATILTIAHRLNTIIDYDCVLVLDAGLIAEYDSPATLLADSESRFSKMVAETGASNAEMLKEIAKQ
ncbi:hypothetical protein HK100_009178 [Physocladia obscura]|uniref:P-loop containing nucleoside triphosphate hydrolase protein n=1 Tax=Physocladia obscura TaxID=109957 RepID=A0AAD5XF94_9FUNG|nr:hypothetical protein HK100_009178 [Physocladia obscura]